MIAFGTRLCLSLFTWRGVTVTSEPDWDDAGVGVLVGCWIRICGTGVRESLLVLRLWLTLIY